MYSCRVRHVLLYYKLWKHIVGIYKEMSDESATLHCPQLLLNDAIKHKYTRMRWLYFFVCCIKVI